MLLRHHSGTFQLWRLSRWNKWRSSFALTTAAVCGAGQGVVSVGQPAGRGDARSSSIASRNISSSSRAPGLSSSNRPSSITSSRTRAGAGPAGAGAGRRGSRGRSSKMSYLTAGLLSLAGLADSSQRSAHTSIQPLMLTTFEGKEAEYIDMNAYNIDYCLHPPNTLPTTALRYYIDGELVFECNTNETAECKAYGLLKGNVKHPKSKNKTCPFLQFFKVLPKLLNRHYICCTPNDTFYRYLQTSTDKSPAPSLPKEFQQLCGHQKNKTEAVHDGTSTEENKTPIIIIGSVLGMLGLLGVVAFKRRVHTPRGIPKHPEQNNNLHPVEEGMTSTGEATQQPEDQENEPLSPDLNC